MLTVALYGNSLVLASVGARIERRIGLRPVTIDAALPGAIEELRALQPDVVVLDLGTAPPDPVMALWKARPEVLLIGVDLSADRLLILSGQPARALTAEDLIELRHYRLISYERRNAMRQRSFLAAACVILGLVPCVLIPRRALAQGSNDPLANLPKLLQALNKDRFDALQGRFQILDPVTMACTNVIPTTW